MRSVRALFVRLAHVLGRRRGAEDFDAELAAHIDLHTEDNIRRGMPPDDARRSALAELGGVERMRQAYREQAGLPVLEQLTQDVRHGLRSLSRVPGFVLVALVTIAVGVAGPTVMFVMAKQWILDPLPFAAPDRLIDLRNLDTVSGNSGPVSIADFLDWKREVATLGDFAAYRRADARWTGIERAERIRGAEASTNFFRVLGAEPAIGRLFAPGDDSPAAASVAVISDTMWRRQFQAAGDIVGRVIRLDGQDHTVVGVLPPAFQFTLVGAVDVWRPLVFDPAAAANRTTRSIMGLARLTDSATLDQARAEVSAIAERLAVMYPETNARRRVRVLTLADEVRLHHDAGFVVPVLFAMMCCVLLVACTNVTNVMLARTSARRQEIAMRLALGASRARVVRQWLVEHVLLFVIASAGGCVLAIFGAEWITASIPAENRQFLRNYGELTLEPVSVAFALLVGAVCGAVFGALPASRSARVDVNSALRDGTTRVSTGVAGARLRGALVVGEIALTLALLISAGFLVVTARNISNADLGFDPRHLLTFELALDEQRYRTPADVHSFYDRLIASIARLPGVMSAGVGTFMPFGSDGPAPELFLDEAADTPRSETPTVSLNEVSGDYAATIGLRLQRGRFLNAQDGPDAPRVAMINEVVARRHFPERNPIGQRIRLQRGSTVWWQIVGVVAAVKNFETIEPDAPQVYVPFAQRPRRDAAIVVRTSANASLAAALGATVAALDPAEPVAALASMEDRIKEETAPYRTISTLVSFFGAVTLLLAGVGLYGVVAYSFAQRTRELGIRMALGARRADVAAMVLAQLRTLLIAGVVPGLVLAWLLGQAMRALLVGVTPSDWRLYVAMTFALVVVAFLAIFVPARRATTIDPMVALRYE